MGTTTTPNLGLIKPDKDEPMLNWPTQLAANLDAIDPLGYVNYGRYTPLWTASTTNPTFGTDGNVEGRWIRIGPHLVIVNINLYTGTPGFLGGSGTYRLSLPFQLHSSFLSTGANGGGWPVGKAYFRDSGTTATSQTGVAQPFSTGPPSEIFINTENGDTAWDPISPFTWANADRVQLQCAYLTEAAL